MRPSHVDHVLRHAAEDFKHQFESELRAKLMAEAEQQVEHMVREISDRVVSSLHLEYSDMDRSFHMTHEVKFNAR